MKEAIILAGGFGTRLAHVLGQNIPKPMAPVAGRPFLSYLLTRLEQQGYEHVVLSTGHLAEKISDYYGSSFGRLRLSYAVEQTPLWTGGAIAYAMQQTEAEDVLVLNGDTLFDIDFEALEDFHRSHHAEVSVALRQVEETARYGRVEVAADSRISAFREKSETPDGEGLINGGIYMIRRKWLLSLGMPEKFSFEKEVLQAKTGEMRCFGRRFENYFIDIGVPDDYHKAQREFPTLFEDGKDLFLDRDGVLNVYRSNDYVKCWDEWTWIDGAREALAKAAKEFRHICIISNQRGISKGLFTMTDLEDVHRHMLRDIAEAGGRIDHIYICTDKEGENRKPNPGMALQAKRDYPEIDFRSVLMVGDMESDIEFGYRLGMQCCYLSKGEPVPETVHDKTDWIEEDLKCMEKHIIGEK